MNRKLRTTVIAGTAVAALAAGGVAVAGGSPIEAVDGDDRAIRGDALDRATAAALDHAGGGRVTETETGDEESRYEVEVTRADGTEVDVQLDRDFQVVQGADSDDDDRAGSDED